MTQFTKSFMWRYALMALAVSRGSDSIMSLVLVALLRSASLNVAVVAYTAVAGAIRAGLIYLIVALSIDLASRKTTEFPQDINKWFRNFYIIIVLLGFLSIFASYYAWTSQVNDLYKQLDGLYGSSADEAAAMLDEILSSFNKALIVALIVGTTVKAVVLLLLMPKMKAKYYDIIPTENTENIGMEKYQ